MFNFQTQGDKPPVSIWVLIKTYLTMWYVNVICSYATIMDFFVIFNQIHSVQCRTDIDEEAGGSRQATCVSCRHCARDTRGKARICNDRRTVGQ